MSTGVIMLPGVALATGYTQSLACLIVAEQLTLDFVLTASGGPSTISYYLEFSEDLLTWFREVDENDAGGGVVRMAEVVRTISAIPDGEFKLSAQFRRIHKFARVQIAASAGVVSAFINAPLDKGPYGEIVVGTGSVTPVVPPEDGEGLTITEYGNYNTPQTFSGASAATFILGQWWYDFSRFAASDLVLFLGVPAKTDGDGTGKFGLFILPDGDPVLGDLFGSTPADLEVDIANLTSFAGYDNAISLANPGVKRQILLAAQPANAATVVSWRSALIKITDTPP